MIKTLAIETSCDDTSIGIVTFDGTIFGVEKLLAYSQVDDHQRFGGVVPEIASRLHSEQIIKVLESVWLDYMNQIDFISVTTHPGLPGSLVVGKTIAHTLGSWFNKPVVEVHHIQWHIFSLFLERNISDIQFPLVVLTASGGHNDLYLVEHNTIDSGSKSLRPEWHSELWQLPFNITKLWQTLDDAAGECFDKVSRMLGGPYPGGSRIGEKAEKWKEKVIARNEWNKWRGDPTGLLHFTRNDNEEHKNIQFKRIFLSKDWFDFSFSWMKSQVSILLKQLEEKNITLTEDLICAIAYEFQEAVVEVLVNKLLKAWLKYGAKTLGISWGVSANDRLFAYAHEALEHKKTKDRNMIVDNIIRPTKKVYSTDNAAMIGVVGILKYIH